MIMSSQNQIIEVYICRLALICRVVQVTIHSHGVFILRATAARSGRRACCAQSNTTNSAWLLERLGGRCRITVNHRVETK